MPLYPYRGKFPQIAEDVFVAPTASVIGDVEIGSGSSVWFNVTIRGDTDRVRIGRNTNVQDNSVIHTEEGDPVIIGANVTIGHGAIVHSSVVGDNVLIGTGSVLVGKNHVGSGSVVGAGAVLPEGMHVPPRKLVVGVPAKILRDTKPEDAQWTVGAGEHYVQMGEEYRRALVE